MLYSYQYYYYYYCFISRQAEQFREKSTVSVRRTMEEHQVVKDVIDTVPLNLVEVCCRYFFLFQ